MTNQTMTLGQAIKRVRKHFRDSMDDAACEAFEFLADRLEGRPEKSVFLGTINGVPVGLHGSKQSVEALEQHLIAALSPVSALNEAYTRGRMDGWDAAPQTAIDEKYGNVLLPFVRLMARELHANAGKGDRPGWLKMSPSTGMLEIYYHAAKLQKAIKDGEGDRITEYAADVANMAMMLLDVCGGLAVETATPHTERAAVPDGWKITRTDDAIFPVRIAGPEGHVWHPEGGSPAARLALALLTAAPHPPEGARVVPEDVEAVTSCLGDDAAFLRMENDGESEIADNMERAIEIIEQLAAPTLAGKEGA